MQEALKTSFDVTTPTWFSDFVHLLSGFVAGLRDKKYGCLLVSNALCFALLIHYPI